MITLKQINTAIIDTIKTALVGTDMSTVSLKAEDITEPIKRPSIKVQLENDLTGKFNSCNKERTLTVRVYFFAKDRYKYKLDNLEMQEILENAFLDYVKVTDTFYMPITDDGMSFQVTDSVLNGSFDLYSIEEIPDSINADESDETMNELDLNLNYEGE
jgi:hypothetical protein